METTDELGTLLAELADKYRERNGLPADAPLRLSCPPWMADEVRHARPANVRVRRPRGWVRRWVGNTFGRSGYRSRLIRWDS